MNWHCIELHTHTEHSDGSFTPTELVKAGKARGFEAIALTDHNTKSGHYEYKQALEECNMVGIPGIEWTTYWGHMLVLNENGYTDWRGVKPPQIDRAIQSVHNNNGLVGIAHPFSLSNPINTGYHWEFQVANWEDIDFLEVWSRDYAPIKIHNYRAMNLWQQLLNRGCHITATSGRDWHREDNNAYAHTFIGTDDKLTTESILKAIKNGRVCLAAGALLTMCGDNINVGDTVNAGEYELTLTLNDTVLPNDWDRENVKSDHIEIINNGDVIAKLPAKDSQNVKVNVKSGWFRADCKGIYHGRENQTISMTNPIYVL